ncbi:MAG: hypothetical protein WAZ48_08425 [Lysobacteraceae bacterium]
MTLLVSIATLSIAWFHRRAAKTPGVFDDRPASSSTGYFNRLIE